MDIAHEISEFLRSYGVDPLVGGFIAGLLLCALAKARTANNKSESRSLSQGNRSVLPTEVVAREQPLHSSLRIRVHVNGKEKEVRETETTEIVSALERGDKIDAITSLRESTGIGLKEARDLIAVLDRGARETLPTRRVAMRAPVTPYSWSTRLLLFFLVGGSGLFTILSYAGVIYWPPIRRCRAIFCDPYHWQVFSFGLAFWCAGFAFFIPEHLRIVGRLNSICLLVSLLAGIIGAFAAR